MTIQGIHVDNVTSWFGDHTKAMTPPLQFDLIAGGHSNLTFKVTDQADLHWVLRRPPLFQVLESAPVAAVLDWELCTLGDRLTDVAALLTYWARPTDTFTPIDIAPTLADGFPERDQLLDWYQQAVGRDIENIDFYRSFASWRLASILEGVYSRYVSGAMGDSEPEGGAQAFVGRIDALVAQAADHAAKVA